MIYCVYKFYLLSIIELIKFRVIYPPLSQKAHTLVLSW